MAGNEAAEQGSASSSDPWFIQTDRRAPAGQASRAPSISDQFDDTSPPGIWPTDPSAIVHALVGLRHASLIELLAPELDLSTVDAKAAAQAGLDIGPGAEVVRERRELHAKITADQDAFITESVEPAGLQPIAQLQVLENAIIIRGTLADILKLRHLPMVEGISPAPMEEMNVGRAGPYIGAKGARERLGLTGEDVLIAVIDTGIDYTHASFGGRGGSQAFENNDPNVIDGENFPGPMVIGGVDLAGSFYAADCPLFPPPGLSCSAVPQPDPDPLDEFYLDGLGGQGHGTHVAGIIAGRMVRVEFDRFGIGIGIAPDSQLMAIRVFGTPRSSEPHAIGATALTVAGLDWVAGHNLNLEIPGVPATDEMGERRKIDIVNVSVGASYASRSQLYDRIVDGLRATGALVVASAGNSGESGFVVGAPSTAKGAISVAASKPPFTGRPQFEAVWSNGQISTVGVEAAESLTLRLQDLGSINNTEMAFYGLACNEDGSPSQPRQDLENKIALVERGECLFSEKIANAVSFGAIAVVVYSDSASVLQMTGGCGKIGGSCYNLPAIMIDRSSGFQLRTRLLAQRIITATLRFDVQVKETDRIDAASSRGPSRFEARIKPQITAPGHQIVSSHAGSGDKRRTLSGTSFAAPMVSGALALLIQDERTRPETKRLTGLDLAAQLMNQSTPLVHDGEQGRGPWVPVARQGAGRLQILKSAESELHVGSQEGAAALSFGHLHLRDSAYLASQTVTVSNRSAVSKTFNIDARFHSVDDLDKGVRIDPSVDSLQLDAGESKTVEIKLSVDPGGLRAWNLPGIGRDKTLSQVTELGELEYDGYLEFREIDEEGQPIDETPQAGLPFYVLPQRHACGSALVDSLELDQDPDQASALSLRNDCLEPGGFASYLQIATDPDIGLPASIDIENIGMRVYQMPAEARDPAFPNLRLQMAEIIINTSEPWKLPLDRDLRVFFDIDGDGRMDRVGQMERLTGPQFGSFVTAVDPVSLEPDWAGLPINPDTGNVRLFLAYMPYDLGASTRVLRFLINHPHFGIAPDLDLTDGDLALNIGLRFSDSLADLPRDENFPGYDDAPNDLLGGELIRFEQAAQDCLRIECPGCALPIDGSGGELTPLRSAGGQETLQISSCQNSRKFWPDDQANLLLHFPQNLPGDTLHPLRLALPDRPFEPAYLPSLSSRWP